jgi:hypothetical protein
MHDLVTVLFEDGGRPLAKHRLAFPLQRHEGLFVLKETRCDVLRRTVLLARLLNAENDDVIAPLYDAKVVYFDGGEARVAGLELDTLNRKFTGQTWHVRIGGHTPG